MAQTASWYVDESSHRTDRNVFSSQDEAIFCGWESASRLGRALSVYRLNPDGTSVHEGKVLPSGEFQAGPNQMLDPPTGGDPHHAGEEFRPEAAITIGSRVLSPWAQARHRAKASRAAASPHRASPVRADQNIPSALVRFHTALEQALAQNPPVPPQWAQRAQMLAPQMRQVLLNVTERYRELQHAGNRDAMNQLQVLMWALHTLLGKLEQQVGGGA